MIWLAARTYELAELSLPDDWQDRLAAAHNKELAASIKATKGPIHLPVIENATGEIVAGVDRIAAQVVVGQKSFEGRGWVGAAEEKRMVRAAENAFRRQDRDAWATEYMEAKRAVKAANASQRDAQYSAAATKNCAGQPKTAETALREEAAAELGMEPEALRGRLRREAETGATPAPAPKPPKVAPIESRIRVLARECEEQRGLITALYDELTETQHEARRLLHKAMLARVDLQDALTGAAEAIDAGRAALRDASKPSAETRGRTAGSRVTADPAPKRGLGGRKLRAEPAEGAQGEAFEAAPRPPCSTTTESGAPCGLPLGHEGVCDPEAF